MFELNFYKPMETIIDFWGSVNFFFLNKEERTFENNLESLLPLLPLVPFLLLSLLHQVPKSNDEGPPLPCLLEKEGELKVTEARKLRQRPEPTFEGLTISLKKL
jgi:hypothetical protein